MDSGKNIGSTEDAFRALFVALLSVNQYSLEHTWSSVTGLAREGLFDPVKISRMTSREIADRMIVAGCNRGSFMTRLFADRLLSVSQFIVETGLHEVGEALRFGSKRDIEKLVLPARGIGPRVIENFLIMRGDL